MTTPMTTRRFDLVVFDWDGTLFDSTALIARCIQEACRDVGAPVPSITDASYVIGLGLRDALEHVAPGLDPSRYGELGQRYRHHYVQHQDDLTLFDGALELLAELEQRGCLLAVATGKARRGLDQSLAHAEIAHVFDATRTADETASKPDPTMLHELMLELDTPPERTLMIGDTVHDLEMARRAGTPRVAVSYGAHAPESFDAYDPLAVVHSMRELRTWFDRHG
jgi:phosphoglycolate phosphatase